MRDAPHSEAAPDRCPHSNDVFHQRHEHFAAADAIRLGRTYMRARTLRLEFVRFYGPVATILLSALVAEAKLARSGDAQVSFRASGPGGLAIVGTTPELTVAEAGDDVIVTVPLRSLDTKIELRNKHMREKYLEVAKYPNAELRVAKAAVQASSGKATGQLTIHGQTKPVTFSYATKPASAATDVTSSFRIDILEFGIEKPTYAGIGVRPEVDVTVAFHVTKD